MWRDYIHLAIAARKSGGDELSTGEERKGKEGDERKEEEQKRGEE